MGTNWQAAKRLGGGATRIARQLEISPQAVSQWRRVPAGRVLDIERLTGISRHHLRPDVYGKAKESEAAE